MAAYNERMKAARQAKRLSFERAAARASRLLLESQEFGESTCRRTEQEPEEKADPVRVWALAQVYGVPLEELSPVAAKWFASTTNGGGIEMIYAGTLAPSERHPAAAVRGSNRRLSVPRTDSDRAA